MGLSKDGLLFLEPRAPTLRWKVNKFSLPQLLLHNVASLEKLRPGRKSKGM